MVDLDFRKEIAQFNLNFRPYEEFYDPSKAEAQERAKKMKMYGQKLLETQAATTMNTTLVMPKEEQAISIVPPEYRYQLNYSAYFSKAGQATVTDFAGAPNFEVQKEEVPLYELDPAQNVHFELHS